jgi:hypothetical protein
LFVFSIRPELWQWYRTVELLTLVPVLAAVATGMLAMFQAVVGQFYVAVVVALGRIPGSLPVHGAVPPCGRVECLQRKFDISRVTCATGVFATPCPGTSTGRRRRRDAASHNKSTSRRTR